MKRKNRGFTLIEIVIVVMIIGILATAIVPRLVNNLDRARDVSRKADMRNISIAVESYAADVGQYPRGAFESWQFEANGAYPLTNYITSIPKDTNTKILPSVNDGLGIRQRYRTGPYYLYVGIIKGFVDTARDGKSHGTSQVNFFIIGQASTLQGANRIDFGGYNDGSNGNPLTYYIGYGAHSTIGLAPTIDFIQGVPTATVKGTGNMFSSIYFPNYIFHDYPSRNGMTIDENIGRWFCEKGVTMLTDAQAGGYKAFLYFNPTNRKNECYITARGITGPYFHGNNLLRQWMFE